MANVKDYDPKQVIITWIPVPAPGVAPGPIALNKGIADGTFVVVARDVPVNSKRIGGDGEGTRIRNNNRAGTISVTLRAGSETNDLISTILSVYESTGLGAIGAFSVKDFTGTSLCTSPQAYPQGWPSKSNSSESEDDLVWVFEAHDLVMFLGGNREAGGS